MESSLAFAHGFTPSVSAPIQEVVSGHIAYFNSLLQLVPPELYLPREEHSDDDTTWRKYKKVCESLSFATWSGWPALPG